MDEQDLLRRRVYGHYLAAAGAQASYMPQPIPDVIGDALYAPHLAGIGPGERIVEVGAGAGDFLAYLAHKGFTNASGVDLSQQLAGMAVARGHKVVQGEAREFLRGLAAESCGAVVAIDVIEHLPKPELFELLDETMRVLRPGGVVLLQTVNGQGLFPGQIMFGDLTHVTILNPPSLAQLLSLCGFTAIAFHESGPVGRSRKDRLRKLAWRLVKWTLNSLRWIEARKRQDIWTENMICVCRKPEAPRA